MLVLTRKTHESIKIGDSITVTLLQIRGNAVRIGIDAPPDVPITRGELVDTEADQSTEDSQPSDTQET